MRQSVLFVERRVHCEPAGHRALAAAVIKLALDDLQSTGYVSAVDRRTATALLDDRFGDLTCWCSVAGLNPQVVRERARRVLADE
jgi:hypothetical protein